jgi:hypothetical protein
VPDVIDSQARVREPPAREGLPPDEPDIVLSRGLLVPPASFGGDDHVVPVSLDSFADPQLAVVVSDGGVEEVYAEVDGFLNKLDCLVERWPLYGYSPHSDP